MKSLFSIFCSCFIITFSFSQNNPTTFGCTGTIPYGLYISSASSSTSGDNLTYSSSKLSSIITGTGVATTLCTDMQIGVSLNGMGYNSSDKFLYAVSRYDATQFSGKLYRIGENCQKLVIPVTPGPTGVGDIVKFNTNNKNTIDAAGGNISSGTFDNNNNYYVNTSFTNVSSTGFTNKIQKIAISGNTATVVSTKTLTCPSCTGGEVQVTDIIFDEATGLLFGNNKITNKLYSINAATGVMTEIGLTGITTSILGIYKNQSGLIRAIDETGKIYSVNTSTGVFTFLSQANNLSSSNSDAASGCFAKAHISGKLFIDANGLVDNKVNGIGTQKAGTTNMYANLVQNNLIVGSVLILPDGSYEFFGTFSGSYEVQISSNQGVVGVAPPAQNLPSTHSFVGDFIGTTIGSDGTPNGKLSFALSLGASLENINFGIDAKPVANDVNAPSQSNPGGTVKVTVPALSVTDAEDIVPTTIVILSIPNQSTMGTLYYNNIPVTAGQTIVNYQPSLLQFDPIDGQITAIFNYQAKDAAGLNSNTARVTMNFTIPLPIVLLSFEGKYVNSNVELTWTTSAEVNSDYFAVQRSERGDVFETIGILKTAGFSNDITEYSFIDKIPIQDYYYRLKEVDVDGDIFYSPIIFIKHKNKPSFNVYPTVFQDGVFIKHNEDKKVRSEVNIYNNNGKKVISTMLTESNQYFDLHHLPSGFYNVVITNMGSGNTITKKIMKSNH